MRDQWYGDNRDLVKWGALLHIARKYGAKRIIQVPYSRPSVWGSLEIDGEESSIPHAVLDHFRNLRAVTKLVTDPQIQVIDTPFVGRRVYMREVLKAIAGCRGKRCVVFLDPDTGLEPRTPGLEHVLASELGEIWRQMSRGDILVFYQHQTNWNGAPWIEPKRKQYEAALGVVGGSAKVARGPKIARDVAFFYCQKRNTTAGEESHNIVLQRVGRSRRSHPGR